jgi:DNA-binding MarR family transcriptional regulator
MEIEKSENPSYDLFRSMDYLCRLINSARSKKLRRIGLSYETASILSGVYKLNNYAMPIELSRYGRRKPQSITEELSRMEKKGLLIKTRDEKKKNVFRVSLTEKGLAAHEKVQKIAIFEKIFSALSEERLQSLGESLELLKDKAKKIS